MRFAIIGSGLSAWTTYQALKARIPTAEITFIDSGRRFNNITDQDKVVGAQKLKFGSDHMYKSNNSGIKFATPSNFSMANGGLSTVWGAGLRIWPKNILEELGLDANSIYKSAKALLEFIPYSGSSQSLGIPDLFEIADRTPPPGSTNLKRYFKIYENDKSSTNEPCLAVDVSSSNACVGCGKCLTGCPYGSIFDAGDRVDELIARGMASRKIGVVRRLQQFGNIVRINLDGVGELKQLEYDHVFLCAGAIGTPAILMKSKLLPDELEVKDSQVFYFAGIKTPTRKHKENFALSQMSHYAVQDNHRIYASFYESNSETRKRIGQQIRDRTRLPVKNIPAFLDRFIFLGIGFLHSNQSGIIKLKSEPNSEVTVSIETNADIARHCKKAVRILAKNLNNSYFKILPKTLVRTIPGAGFHSGCGAELNSFFVGKYGEIKNAQHIHICDSTLLSKLEPGPHTFTHMCLVYGLLQECKL